MQVIEESVAAAAAAAPGTPGKASRSAAAGGASDAEGLARELADVKKRFLAVAKKKQADYAKRIKEVEDALHLAEEQRVLATSNAEEGEKALKACMARVAELESKVDSEPQKEAPQVGQHK